MIYTLHITNRIKYIMQYVFEERLGIEYSITNDKQVYKSAATSLKISYTNESCDEGLYFYAVPLLFEKGIQQIQLNEKFVKGAAILFAHDKNAALTFDAFAAIFYLLSRYEEYLNDPRDKHGNYDYTNSILYKLNVLDTPLVEQWIEMIKDILIKNFPSIRFKDHKAKFGLSFDIDVAYAYKNRSAAILIAGFVKKILLLNLTEAKDQLLTLLNRKEDIYDTYQYIFSSIKNIKPIFFFDMGRYGRFDKNPPYKNKKFRQLIQSISEKALVGIHPSYASDANNKLVAAEKSKLEQITGKPVTASRQHYLKLKLPSTYNLLINNNIAEDFTMGYSGYYGFRAGTCNPFLFFNLVNDQQTQLHLYPFAYMEVTLNNYLTLSIDEAKKIISKLIQTVKKYNGTFIPLWHNSTLCNRNEWKGWREVFEHTLYEISNNNLENIFN
jgi:hypothetical protein